jgi:hypothetical protein
LIDVDAEEEIMDLPAVSGGSFSDELEHLFSPSESATASVPSEGSSVDFPFTDAENQLMVRHIVSWGTYEPPMWKNLAVSLCSMATR